MRMDLTNNEGIITSLNQHLQKANVELRCANKTLMDDYKKLAAQRGDYHRERGLMITEGKRLQHEVQRQHEVIAQLTQEAEEAGKSSVTTECGRCAQLQEVLELTTRTIAHNY